MRPHVDAFPDAGTFPVIDNTGRTAIDVGPTHANLRALFPVDFQLEGPPSTFITPLDATQPLLFSALLFGRFSPMPKSYVQSSCFSTVSGAYSGLAPPHIAPVRWRACAVAAGYSIASWALLLRVETLRERLGISTSGNTFAAFMAATAGINIGAVLGLLLQPVLLASVSRLHRACIGLALQALANAMFLVAFFCTPEPLTKSIWVVALGFTTVGFGRTVAESNAQTLMAAYGAEAQRFQVLGVFASWSGAGVVYFTLQAIFGISYVLGGLFHLACVCGCAVVIGVLLRLPSPDDVTIDANDDDGSCIAPDDSVSKTIQDIRIWRLWLPPVSARLVVATVLYALSVYVIALIQLVYSRNSQELLPGLVVSPSIFMILFCIIESIGGCLGSVIVPYLSHPSLWAVLAGAIGVACTFSRVPLLALLSSGAVCAGCAVGNTVATVAIATETQKRYTLTGMLLLGFMAQLSSVFLQTASGPWAVIIGRVDE